jgi:MATE family multidrug resistance protein
MQYLSLMSYAVDGFAFAAESLVGRFSGARDLSKLKQSVRLLFLWGIGLGVFFALCYGLFGNPLLRVFTDQVEIIQTAVPYVFWVVIVTIAGSVAYLWDGVYIGATASVAMRNMMLISTLGVFLPAYYLTITPLGNHGLWLALTLFMIARGLTLGLLAKKNIFTFR